MLKPSVLSSYLMDGSLPVGDRSCHEDDRGGPPTSPNRLERQIRFGLSDLSPSNGAHDFEKLCRHFAQARLVSNVLPATGPVAAHGDQGRDFETFQTFLRDELGPHGAFLGLVSESPVAFACTLRKDKLPGKIRSDVEKILASGTEVVKIYAFLAASMPVGTRHGLQEEIKEAYGVEIEILDQHMLAAQLACPDVFWIAVEYLSIPAELAPAREDRGEDSQPAWYLEARERWRERGAARPLLTDVLDVKGGLSHAVFDHGARGDLPFWLGLMRSALADGADLEVRQRVRYEVAVAMIRGIRDLRPADAEVRSYMAEIVRTGDGPAGDDPAGNDPVHLQDATVLLSYATTAAMFGRTSIAPGEMVDWLASLRERVYDQLNAHPQPTRRARLLQVRGQLGLLRDPGSVTVPADPMELPDTADLDEPVADRAPASSVPPAAGGDLVDIDDAMDAWRELARQLPDTPLFPVDEMSEILRVLAPVLVDHAHWSEIVEAFDAAVARAKGGAAAAACARDRASVLLDVSRLRNALRELHRVKAGLWSGDTLRGALLTMLSISRCYAQLNLPLAAKQYALATAGVASGGGSDVRDLVPAGMLNAADVEYRAGAWCSALELIDLGMMAHRLLADESVSEVARETAHRAIGELGILLRGARILVPALVPRIEDIARRHGVLELVQRALEEIPDEDADAFIQLVDEQLQSRPFSDLGAERVIRFKALGLEWRIHCQNVYRHVLAAERLAAIAQIMSVELADDDLCLLPAAIDIRVELLEGTLDNKDKASLRLANDSREWVVQLTPFVSRETFDFIASLDELLAVLSMVFFDVSLLSKERYAETFKQTMERDFWHKVVSGRPYDERAAVVPEQRFDAVRRHELQSRVDPLAREVSEHAELAWQAGPGPTYSEATAHKLLAHHYEHLPAIMPRTLLRLQRDPSFLSTAAELRASGWRDWHLLNGVYNVLVQFRIANAGLNTREALEAPGAAEAVETLLLSPEGDDGPEIPLEAFSASAIRWGLGQSLPSTTGNWNLHLHSPHSGSAIGRLLTARYAFWTDDIEHDDPFEPRETQTV